jgi:AraC-like DNA-binding protein
MDIATQEHVITRELDDFQQKLGDLVDPAWPVDVRAFLHHTHAHLFDPDFTVRSARRACGLRSNSLRVCFKRCLGTTMQGYVEDRRMFAALRLLDVSEKLEVGAIALRLGYSCPRVFTRAFRRCFGAPPTALRPLLGRKQALLRRRRWKVAR